MMRIWKLILGLPVDIGLWLLTALRWIAVPPGVWSHKFPAGHFLLRCTVFGLLCCVGGLGGWIRLGMTTVGFEPPIAVRIVSIVLSASTTVILAVVSLAVAAEINDRWPRRR